MVSGEDFPQTNPLNLVFVASRILTVESPFFVSWISSFQHVSNMFPTISNIFLGPWWLSPAMFPDGRSSEVLMGGVCAKVEVDSLEVTDPETSAKWNTFC